MIPTILKNFLNSEKAIAAGVLAAIATVFVFTNRITVQEWMDYTEVLLAIYVGGKAVQGGAAAIANGRRYLGEADKAKAELASLIQVITANDDRADKALEP